MVDEPRPGRIESIFATYFESWHIRLPEGAVEERARGTIQQEGWTIRYVFGEEDRERYLEFYAVHRMTNDRRHRIYDSGRMESLDAIESLVVSNPDVPGDEERARRENREHNRRVVEELDRLGLNPAVDIGPRQPDDDAG
jgi:hypothetical protein